MKCASCGATTDAATDTCLHCGRNLYALTLGSGSPHMLRSIFVDNWEAVILGSSLLADAPEYVQQTVKRCVQMGPYEIYDARVETPGWDRPGYSDTGWTDIHPDSHTDIHAFF